MKKIFVSTGEISGDLYAANLVEELKKQRPHLEFWGIGHTKLAKAGVKIIADLTTASTIGIFEPIKYLPKIIYTFLKVKSFFRKVKPDLVIVIDYQGFHMQVIRLAKKLKIPVVYYIAPQEWLWGSEAGGLKVVKNTDLILAIFKEEADFYKNLGGNISFSGHPLVDIVKSTISKEEFARIYGINLNDRVLSVFPGSRWQEINKTFPVLLDTAINLSKKYPDFKIFISVSSEKFEVKIKEIVEKKGLKNVVYYKENIYDLIMNTYLSLTVSGTITLEHAILGTPALVGYRFNPISFWLIMFVLRKKLDKIGFMALTNIIFRREIMPEFMQYKCTPEALGRTADFLLQDPAAYVKLKADLTKIRDYIGQGGSVVKSAQSVLALLDKR
ncbi:MAG: lipid-A-disaccharide synthase [Candidatus Margulisiibacteriota bacterium]|jgi:lipid-A-disaccharide synthase